MSWRASHNRVVVAYIASQMNFYIPILIVCFLQRGLSAVDAGILMATYTASLTVFEVPSGIAADMFGKQRVIVCGLLVKSVGILGVAYGEGMFVLVVSQVIIGLGDTSQSGAVEGLLYEHMAECGQVEQFRSVFRSMASMGTFALSASYLAGAWLYDVAGVAVFICAAVVALGSAVIFATVASAPSIPRQAWRGCRRVGVRGVRLCLLSYPRELVFESFMMLLYFQLFQLCMINVGIDAAYNGIIYMIVGVAFGVGAGLAGRRYMGEQMMYRVAPCAVVSCMAIMLVGESIVLVLVYIALRFIWGAYSTNFSISLNSSITDNYERASILSMAGWLIAIMASGLYYVGGVLYEAVGARTAIVILLGVFVVLYIGASTVVASRKTPDAAPLKC